MKLFISISILLVCAILILGSPNNDKNNKTDSYWETPTYFCGSKLPREMAIICNGRYNEDKGSQRFKTKRGIHNECCLSKCKRKYLKDNYCAPEPQMSSTTTTTPNPNPTLYHVTYFAYHMDLVTEVMKYFQMFE